MTQTDSTITSLTLSTNGNLQEWSQGSRVQICNPTHEDHGKYGVIIGFQICAAPESELEFSDDQGWVYPIVSLNSGDGKVLFVIPFDRLRLREDD
jgi:hypothetical protein